MIDLDELSTRIISPNNKTITEDHRTIVEIFVQYFSTLLSIFILRNILLKLPAKENNFDNFFLPYHTPSFVTLNIF